MTRLALVLLLSLCAAFVAEAPNDASPFGSGLFAFGERNNAAAASDYASGVNPLIAWRDLEPERGGYDWRLMDSLISQATEDGKTMVPRLLTNTSSVSQATPDWFFDLPGADFYYSSADAESLGFKAPVPWDPLFHEEFGRFLEAFGERYNGNPTIEFLQTNAGGGLYGEVVLTIEDRLPVGWNPDRQLTGITYWLERWTQAFPDTNLALMVNPVGYDIGERAAAYAVSLGVYLQQNTPWLSEDSITLLAEHQDETAIILEVEDVCRSAEGEAFEDMIRAVFSYGIAIDYLQLCPRTFDSASTAEMLPIILRLLR